jgi:hypothetical protein
MNNIINYFYVVRYFYKGANLSKSVTVSMDVLIMICTVLDCEIGEVME